MMSSKAKDRLDISVTWLWRQLFHLGGRISRSTPEILAPKPDERILVIAPHPDDETGGCGGTIARHIKAGAMVHVVWVTDGRQSRAHGLDAEQMARQRRQEAQDAAEILQLTESTWWGLPEGEWHDRDLQDLLRPMLGDYDYIYAPSLLDFHPEHRHVAFALAPLLKDGPILRSYQLQVPLTARLTNLISDTSAESEITRRALAAFTTQQGSLTGSWRLRRYAAAYYGLPLLAESFWQMTASAYRALHARYSQAGDAPVRSVRYRSWADPVAYFQGRTFRRQLVTASGS